MSVRGFVRHFFIKRIRGAGFILRLLPVLISGALGDSLCGESCAENLTPQTVILDSFEARQASVTDVLEALTLTVERVTNQSYKPNFVIVGIDLGQMKVSLSLKDAPLSDALDKIDELPGVRVTYSSKQTIVFSQEHG